MNPTILDVADLRFAYPGQPPIVAGWSASIAAGVTLLQGDTGSGKSTLLRVLAGTQPAEGWLTLAGVRLDEDAQGYQRNVFFCDPPNEAFEQVTAREATVSLSGGDTRFSATRWHDLVEGFALAHAGEALRTSGATTLTDRELRALADHFPGRAPLRPVQAREAPANAPSPMRADQAIDEEEHITHFNTVRTALSSALMSLDPEARLIVHMHFAESMSLADIARGLSVPQKPLYRKLHRALVTLRLCLERTGITQSEAHEVVNRHA